MEYALDRNGHYVHHSVAKKSNLYKCPYCREEVFIRRAPNACFYHRPIHDRTPLQRTCPEYHEGTSRYGKIDNPIDILYINNGGIPLYLCNSDENFQLRAYFPTISENSFNKLRELGAKVYVNTKAYSKIDRKIYNVDNLKFYPVNTIEKWIYVKCEPRIHELDVRRKWLWGIRGVDIENDIYHSNKDGGYRVALKANINVGKTYRIMFDKYPPKIEGINFERIGEIWLREKSIRKLIGIYEMNIFNYTESAKEFIEGKGYHLVEKSNELIPLWPPAVFKGNEITFNQQEAFFLHINNSGKEKLYLTLYHNLLEIKDIKNKRYSIVKLQVYYDRSMAISDEEIRKYNSEIKYSTIYNKSLVKKQSIKPVIKIKDINNIEMNFDEKNLKLPKDRKIYIESNIPFCATVNNKNYIISSSSTCFENIDYLVDLKINSKAFGIKSYRYKREKPQIKTKSNLNWELEYSRLYRCVAPTIKANNQHFQLLYLLSQNTNGKNIQMYRLLETWIKTNAVPVSAISYIDRIFKTLGGCEK